MNIWGPVAFDAVLERGPIFKANGCNSRHPETGDTAGRGAPGETYIRMQILAPTESGSSAVFFVCQSSAFGQLTE